MELFINRWRWELEDFAKLKQLTILTLQSSDIKQNLDTMEEHYKSFKIFFSVYEMPIERIYLKNSIGFFKSQINEILSIINQFKK